MYVSNKLKMSFWGRIIYDITRLATWVIGKLMFRVSVENPGNVPKEGGLLIVSNHVSHLDPPLTGSFLPRRCGYHMAKMELFGIGILRVYMLSIGSIMVNRGKGKQALLEAVQYLNDGQVVFIFPEGTRSKSGRLMEGKSGAVMMAIRTGCTILPSAIIGSQHAMRKGSIFIRPVKIRIRYGEPYRIEYDGDPERIPKEVMLREMARMMQKIEDLLPEDMRPDPADKERWYGVQAG
ncbi:MAG: 1-acyl-sn-glycerol-3-phosphate acyltransferase [Planctomycetales bacterium]|nr:1-acyl-sn-glycerol-3-phosphate acyltransferase [bacterium]UNM07889.1 MAG: 1-acyl-sn-glycerol-3-phosphate acyltransferase [Planctomycetales bacterium]